MSIESRFDVPFIAELALREKQIQQSYRPVIAVHKWFARRPGTLFRGLMLAEFGTGDLRDSFYRSNDLTGIRIVDPFMGGGTPMIEANRVGCDVDGWDVNPMSAWIVREEIERIDLAAYESDAADLMVAFASAHSAVVRAAVNPALIRAPACAPTDPVFCAPGGPPAACAAASPMVVCAAIRVPAWAPAGPAD